MEVVVRAVLVGKTRPLGRRGWPSGIDKRPVEGRRRITITGLVGDEQGDTKHHGGPEKAVHHYAFDHYAAWRAEMPEGAPRLASPGAFGENISTLGMTEAQVCVGDVYRLGTAVVQVAQGRQPCWRLNERFADPSMARKVQDSARTGWYYRVLEEGDVGAGDIIRLLDRPAKAWSIARILRVLYRTTLATDELAELAGLAHLAESWRVLAHRRLELRAVEDWSRRLVTPEAADQPH